MFESFIKLILTCCFLLNIFNASYFVQGYIWTPYYKFVVVHWRPHNFQFTRGHCVERYNTSFKKLFCTNVYRHINIIVPIYDCTVATLLSSTSYRMFWHFWRQFKFCYSVILKKINIPWIYNKQIYNSMNIKPY